MLGRSLIKSEKTSKLRTWLLAKNLANMKIKINSESNSKVIKVVFCQEKLAHWRTTEKYR